MNSAANCRPTSRASASASSRATPASFAAASAVFDLVLMANLIDRLPDPARCLAQLPALVAPRGWLVLTSPYTWLEEYTPRERWLDRGDGTLAALRAQLAPAFSLGHNFDLPMLIRDHRRKYQWTVTEAPEQFWQAPVGRSYFLCPGSTRSALSSVLGELVALIVSLMFSVYCW